MSAERGHQVTLIEKGEELGGQITIAAKAPQRDQMAGITRWLVMELERLGVEIILNTTVSAEMVREMQPDVCILATGGRPFIDQNPEWGAEEGLVVSSWDILNGTVEPGKNVADL